MDDKDPPTETSQLLLTPLMISMIGIVSTALAILLYNFILNRLSGGRAIMMQPSTPETEKGTGVEEKVLDSIPTLPYTTEEGGLFRMDQIECPVCLGEFEEGEVVRLLPSCKHIFHVKCIDEWFLSHTNCPVCRSAIVAPLMSSEHSITLEVDGCSEQSDVATHCFPEGEGRPSRVRSMSVVLAREGKVSSLQGVVKRSMSLDFSYLAIKIQRDKENDSSSSSMSKKSNSLDHGGSSKRFDRVSSLLSMSCSRLQSNQSGDSNVILPH